MNAHSALKRTLERAGFVVFAMISTESRYRRQYELLKRRGYIPAAEKRRAFCDAFLAINGTHGVNLTRHNYPALHGTRKTPLHSVDNLDDALLPFRHLDQR